VRAGPWEGDGRMARDLFDLTGKAAMVTGAGQGLGREFARALARAVPAGRRNSRERLFSSPPTRPVT